MPPSRRRDFRALVALASSACSTWHAESGPVPLSDRAVASTRTQALRVTLKSGADVFVVMARVEGDSLVGYTRDNRKEFARAAIPVGEVYAVSTYRISGALTILGAIGVILASFLALISVCFAGIAASGGF